MFPLKKGSKGNEVSTLQTYLNSQLPAPVQRLDVDGNFGPLTETALFTVMGKREVSREHFGLIAQYVSANLQNTSGANFSQVNFYMMTGEELINWIVKNDMKIQHALLLLREADARLTVKGIDTSYYKEQLRAVSERYNRRIEKISTDGYVRTNKAVGDAYKWLVDKWETLIGTPLHVAAGVVIVGAVLVTGSVIISRYMDDAVSSREDIEKRIPALMAAYQKLDQSEYDSLINQIQTFGAKKYQSGTAGSLASAIKYGVYLVGGILVVSMLKNVSSR